MVAGLNGEPLDGFFLARDDSLSSLNAFLDIARGACSVLLSSLLSFDFSYSSS